MCLILIGWQVAADHPLLVAANRDEFYARPTAAAARWPEAPQLIAGRDLEAGGTWLGITDSGRFAAVTNVREPGQAPGRRSRGDLTRDFLLAECSAADYAASLAMADFAGFNLLVCDGQALYYVSNRQADIERLPPGIYGLSNHRLDTPWPKLLQARQAFAEAIQDGPDEAALFSLLADTATVADARLPSTGVSRAWERRLSAVFVQSENYGTRASTVLACRADGSLRLHERSFGPYGQPLQSSLITTLV